MEIVKLSAAQIKAAKELNAKTDELLKADAANGIQNVARIGTKFGIADNGKNVAIALNSEGHRKITQIEKGAKKFNLDQYWVTDGDVSEYVTDGRSTGDAFLPGVTVTLKVEEVNGRLRASIV